MVETDEESAVARHTETECSNSPARIAKTTMFSIDNILRKSSSGRYSFTPTEMASMTSM